MLYGFVVLCLEDISEIPLEILILKMEIISKKDPVEKIEDLNRKGKIKTLFLKKDPRTPTANKSFWGWNKNYGNNYKRIFGK